MANKNLIKATILFVDLVDSIELANYWDSKKYNDCLNEFQRCMLNGIDLWRKRIKEIKIVGDELLVLFSSKNIKTDIGNAIDLAVYLKILWWISSTNRKRIIEGKKIFDLGIGINTGKVMADNRPYRKGMKKLAPKRKTLEGFAISLAKRIETFSRQGKYSKIMLGHNSVAEFNKLYHNYEFEYVGLQKLKGLAQEIPIFELKSSYTESAESIAKYKNLGWIIKQLKHIRDADPSNIWLYMVLINIYAHKGNYKRVEKLCKEAIAIDNTVANIHYELAIALNKQKRYDESLLYSDRAINLSPNLWHLYDEKINALIFEGSYEECIKTCKYVISHAPEWYIKYHSDWVYYDMAAAYARKGDKINAFKNLRKAVKIGGGEIIHYLKEDEDRDFYNLYDDPQYKKIIQVKVRKIKR